MIDIVIEGKEDLGRKRERMEKSIADIEEVIGREMVKKGKMAKNVADVTININTATETETTPERTGRRRGVWGGCGASPF